MIDDPVAVYLDHLPHAVRAVADVPTLRRVRALCLARGQIVYGPHTDEFVLWCRCDVLDVIPIARGLAPADHLVAADKRHGSVLFILDALSLSTHFLLRTVRRLARELPGVKAVAAIHMMKDGQFHLRYRRVRHVVH